MRFLKNFYLQKKSDQELMSLVKLNDDQDAFALIYDRHSAAVYSFVRNMVKNDSVSEEIAHEAFLKLYNNRDKYETGRKLVSWLWSIARNLCIDWMRKRKEYAVGDESSIEEMAIDNSEGVLNELIEKSNLNILKASIEKLKTSQKEVLLLWLEEMSLEEISTIVSKSPQAVKNLIHRAKKELIMEINNNTEGL